MLALIELARSQHLIGYHACDGVCSETVDIPNNVRKVLVSFLTDNEIFETANFRHKLTH
jgi:hypothetical protein